MNFNLKRKITSTKPGKKLKTSAFVNNNDGSGSDSEEDFQTHFKSAMAKKSQKVSTQLKEKTQDESEHSIDDSFNQSTAPTPKPKSSQIVKNILEAKELRQKEHAVAQQKSTEERLQKYLEENKDVMVFSSEAYSKEQESVRDFKQEIESKEEDEEREKGSLPSKSFYSEFIRSRAGESSVDNGDKLGQGTKHTVVKPEHDKTGVKEVHTGLQQHDQSLKVGLSIGDTKPNNDEEITIKKATVMDMVMEYIKSKVSQSDIEEAKRKYWERHQSSVS